MRKISLLLALVAMCFTSSTAWAGQDIVINSAIVNSVYGNGAPPDGDDSAWPTLPDNAEDNSVTVNVSGSVGGSVFGGAGAVSATNNSVTVSGGSVLLSAIGGFSLSSTGDVVAMGNRVNISGGSVGDSVSGGFALSNSKAEAKGNSVTIGSGSGTKMIHGGSAMGAEAAATDNRITVSGGNVIEDIFGGRVGSEGDASVTGSIVSFSGGSARHVAGGYGNSNTGDVTITGNKVSISGGSITGNAGGGYIGCPAGNATGTGNTLTISGNPVFDATSGLYGSYIDVGTGDAFSDNRLELKTAISVELARNFEFMDFYLPSDISNGDVMLALSIATSLTNVKVDLKFNTSPPNLAAGDVVTLIDKVSGSFAAKTVTISGYTFEISRTGGMLVAEVTAVPAKKGGGGCNGFIISFGLLALFIPFALKR